MEADLGWRDEWLLGDWIKRGHRWTHPSTNSSPALLLFLVYAAKNRGCGREWSQRGQGTFFVCVSQPSKFCTLYVFFFYWTLFFSLYCILLYNSAAIRIIASPLNLFDCPSLLSQNMLGRQIVQCCPLSLRLFFFPSCPPPRPFLFLVC